ncbi:IclR family transcriptional regulator C-terminal domain-containing protein [Mycobacteroides abscessus]|uniref:IclR family transcriptional regulator C-terminal domain-containing protein n=1 Tax=Mycobacteroides abscessus TaxID=36809 RepID=UPI001F4117E8|nr:IclR family transcriptional regulator C-terminal domain-containing protein [Mycobacteroides abscessus]
MLPADLEAFTPNTITDIAVLLSELNAVRRTGIAFDHEEHDIGISSVVVHSWQVRVRCVKAQQG